MKVIYIYRCIDDPNLDVEVLPLRGRPLPFSWLAISLWLWLPGHWSGKTRSLPTTATIVLSRMPRTPIPISESCWPQSQCQAWWGRRRRARRELCKQPKPQAPRSFAWRLRRQRGTSMQGRVLGPAHQVLRSRKAWAQAQVWVSGQSQQTRASEARALLTGGLQICRLIRRFPVWMVILAVLHIKTAHFKEYSKYLKICHSYPFLGQLYVNYSHQHIFLPKIDL